MDLIPVPVEYHVLSCFSLEPSRFNASKNPETPNYFPTTSPVDPLHVVSLVKKALVL